MQVRQVAAGRSQDLPAVPITVRQLEAIVRISESLARMALRVTATEAHVRQAIDLFKTSTMDAVKAGVQDVVRVRLFFLSLSNSELSFLSAPLFLPVSLSLLLSL